MADYVVASTFDFNVDVFEKRLTNGFNAE